MPGALQPIETRYAGYRFRSRLEARWAVFFDALKIEYEYEPEGFKLSDGTCYLPDFWLPESRAFFEVKGVLSEKDAHKIEQLMADSNCPVIIGYPNFEFEACDNWLEDCFTRASKAESLLNHCRSCGKIGFMGSNGSYVCPCCGDYDGDHLCDWIMRGDGLNNPFTALEVEKAVKAARSARFDHGENPVDWR